MNLLHPKMRSSFLLTLLAALMWLAFAQATAWAQTANPFSREIDGTGIDADFLRRWELGDRQQRSPEAEAKKEVRVVYLVPSDKAIRSDYASAITEAFLNLQEFYRREMGSGFTFALHSPVVEVYRLPHAASWYSTNPSRAGAAQSQWFWENTLNDGFALTGGGFNDPNNRWFFYIDADTACGQSIGGNAGVAVVAANDLRGLVGEQNIPPCPTDPPDNSGRLRWIGGAGHELGHSFNVPHPPGCGGGGPNYGCTGGAFAAGSLMWVGYASYPNTYLLPENKQALSATGFFYNTVSISGRVLRRDGRGAASAHVTLTNNLGIVERIAITNPFGYYRFLDVPWGMVDYQLTAAHKQAQFDPRVVSTNANLFGIDFLER